MKLTRKEIKAHEAACELIGLTRGLDIDERISIVDNWHEGANHVNSAAGAFFTPFDMSFHVGMYAGHGKVLDLCAGIGSLSLGTEVHNCPGNNDFTLVEINPDYAAVARRVMPDAEIIVGSVYDEGLMNELRQRDFDVVISNPPFGSSTREDKNASRYSGPMQYEVIDIASELAPYGVFILPQNDCPFIYSGKPSYKAAENRKYKKFHEKTGIAFECSSVDTSTFDRFRGTNIVTEIFTCDFFATMNGRAAA